MITNMRNCQECATDNNLFEKNKKHPKNVLILICVGK